MKKIDDLNELRKIGGGASVYTFCPNFGKGCYKEYKKTNWFLGSCKWSKGKEKSSSKNAWVLAGQLEVANLHKHGCHEYDVYKGLY